ncbi:MogA/MoaB family molybdenum cofactor biosynthesis protein [Agromyces silvae]|uniref:MogA/MoaB family molybdenum cofactor biosynthesis protein n=1 Tax=Agromyces silvae TaxID=3388266 RepID=UPI00280A824A|nr:MogA/MoaB family molybdenum cofactor biosynthesis protein [Agromyces protaetiae]
MQPESVLRAAVVIVSDRSARGERADAVGPVLVERLRADGYELGGARIVPDGADSVEAALRAEIAAGARLILTSGGTGIGPHDRTPEGTRQVLAHELPGIAEALRRTGAEHVPTAVLSRGLAGVADQPGTGGVLIVNLPGSPGGARDGIEVVLPVARHAIAQLDGGDHDPGHGAGHDGDRDSDAARHDRHVGGRAPVHGHAPRPEEADHRTGGDHPRGGEHPHAGDQPDAGGSMGEHPHAEDGSAAR